jgi:hypothetical protein
LISQATQKSQMQITRSVSISSSRRVQIKHRHPVICRAPKGHSSALFVLLLLVRVSCREHFIHKMSRILIEDASGCGIAPSAQRTLVTHWAVNYNSTTPRKRKSSALRHACQPCISALLTDGLKTEQYCTLGAETSAVRHLPRRFIRSCGVHLHWHPVRLLDTVAIAAIQAEESCPCYLKNFSSTLVATSSKLSIRELQHSEFFLASALCWYCDVDLQS